MPQRLAQAHLRHTDPRLTANTYTDQQLLPIAETITSLPWLPTEPESPDAGAQRATGTAGEIAPRAAHAQRFADADSQKQALTVTRGSEALDGPSRRKDRASQRLSLPGPKRVNGFEPSTFTLATGSNPPTNPTDDNDLDNAPTAGAAHALTFPR